MPGKGIVDEGLWEKAKKSVSHDKYKDNDSYYAVVSTVYKNMGGKYKHESAFDGIANIVKKSASGDTFFIEIDVSNMSNEIIEKYLVREIEDVIDRLKRKVYYGSVTSINEGITIGEFGFK